MATHPTDSGTHVNLQLPHPSEARCTQVHARMTQLASRGRRLARPPRPPSSGQTALGSQPLSHSVDPKSTGAAIALSRT